jgi:uncharacterized protein (TIGR03435 family)
MMTRLGLLMGAVAVALAGVTAAGQSFAFEVASVRPADPTSDESISRASDRLTMINLPVEKVILWAYHLSDDRLLNQPGWIVSTRYDVTAKAPSAELPVGRVNEMMQSLLAERFKLAAHWEKRDGQRYALRVDRNAPKIHIAPVLPGPRPQSPFKMDRGGHLTGLQVSTAMLATVLADQVGRVVVDETGLDGVFDFELDWAPENAQQSPDSSLGSSLFTAIREQLGLRLESTRGPIDVLVIDHVERPTEN